jgi:predicted transcriptional regulator
LKSRCSVDILDAALSGETKSQIMIYAQLNHIQIKRYMHRVLSEELLEERKNHADSSTIYATTKKNASFYKITGKYNYVKKNKNIARPF